MYHLSLGWSFSQAMPLLQNPVHNINTSGSLNKNLSSAHAPFGTWEPYHSS
jgi:hypothetical protein